MNDLAETRLALDDAVGNVEAAAERRQEEDDFEGINVVRNDDERRLLVLDELRHILDAETKSGRPLCHRLLFAVLELLGALFEAIFLAGRRLRTILVEQAEHLSR